MSDYWAPLVATLVGVAFSAAVVHQYLQRRRPHQLYWAVGFIMFTLATGLEFTSEYWGWEPFTYRLYFAVIAPLVAFLAMGTAYLIHNDRRWNRMGLGVVLAGSLLALLIAYAMAGPLTALGIAGLWLAALGVGALVVKRTGHWGHAYAAFCLVLVGAYMVAAMVSPVNMDVLNVGKVGGEGFPDSTRAFSPLITIPASFILIGGALYSWAVVWRAQKQLFNDRAFNLLIAAGALMVAGSGGLAKAGQPAYLYLGELTGLVLMFIGFMRSKAVIARRESRSTTPAKAKPEGAA